MILTEEYLQEEYINKRRSFADIAADLNTYPQAVRRFAIKCGLPIRSKSDSIKAAFSSGRLVSPTKGKKRDAATKSKIGQKVAANWDALDGEAVQERVQKARKNYQNMSEEDKERLIKLASEGSRKAAKEGSRAEKYITNVLKEAGYQIESHKKKLVANKNIHLDIFLPTLSVAIEINGPSHNEPIWGEQNLLRTISADQRKTGLLSLAGIKLIKVWCKFEFSNTRIAPLCKELLEVLKNIELNGTNEFIIDVGEKNG